MNFKIGDLVVYPSHGIGKIIDITEEEIMNTKTKVYRINFIKKQFIISIPISSAKNVGLRELSSKKKIEEILSSFSVPATKKKKIIWSKCSLKYESKINSGDITQIAEIIYDLYSYVKDENCCYSERMLYKNTMNILVDEISSVLEIDTNEAKIKILDSLNKKEEYTD